MGPVFHRSLQAYRSEQPTTATVSSKTHAFIRENRSREKPLSAVANDDDFLIQLYRAMVLTRRFNDRAVALRQAGRLGPYPSCRGREAVSVGFASAMQPDDVMVITGRAAGAQFWRGVTPLQLLRYWGDHDVSHRQPRKIFPPPSQSPPMRPMRLASPRPLRNAAIAASLSRPWKARSLL
ncbi:MAG: thiamine pyrophosphate-dependent enzyme [Proteobacteria bacterium]|nr:thiamine pyrophosphate-dependent enzyme [Pseudomonadota bacterium]